MPKKKSYTVKYKVAVLDWYHTNGNNKRKAAREFGVDPKRIREWVDREDDLRAASCSTKGKSMRKLHPGAEYCVELDNLVLDYLIEERAEGLEATNKMLQEKARELAPGIDGVPPEFCASDGWLRNWKKRVYVGKRNAFQSHCDYSNKCFFNVSIKYGKYRCYLHIHFISWWQNICCHE